MTTQEKQIQWFKKWISKQGLTTEVSLTRLAGDGSTRSFSRLALPDKTFILLWDPDWTLSQDYPEHQTFLKAHGIPVPEFYVSDPKEGALLMEDLGDDLLQHVIQKNPNRKFELIEQAVLLLAQLHGSTFPVPKNLPCHKRFFDKEKYSQELLFTLEHLGEKLLKEKPAVMGEGITAFAEQLEKIVPVCFSHRDYHTRNILPKATHLVLIDFQDARMGPPHYDLASILYDAYMPLSHGEKDTLVKTYKAALKKHGLYAEINWDSFETDLKLVALQRTIKAAGSFASFYTRYNKTTHLPYLLPALEMALHLKTSIKSLPKGFDSTFPLENWIQKYKSAKISYA